jgi:hydrogenase maturation protein HypF
VRVAVTARGTVQGVGFRPFVYRLARRHALSGWVRNSTGPVEIEVEGESQAVERFLAELRDHAPPLARVESLQANGVPLVGEPGFRILASEARAGESEPISPDAATCDDCLAELLDPRDRR